jgi:hypothetical protein
MNKANKIFYFDFEGRNNLSDVIRSIKGYLKSPEPDKPHWVIFLTARGEGPILAYRELIEFDVRIAAVTFSSTLTFKAADGQVHKPEIPEKVLKFFSGVEIPVITNRLPFDLINGADAHNREMQLLARAFGIFGGSVSLAIQAVLQACDAGIIQPGERVIAAAGDCALIVTASGSATFLNKENGLMINEIICKPRTRKRPEAKTIEGNGGKPQALPREAQGG